MLTLIIGCMFSGKSSELIKRVKKHTLLGRKVLVVNHAKDVRYNHNTISSHDNSKIDAITHNTLLDIINTDAFKQADVVCVDEGQFFHDLYDTVIEIVDTYQKHVIISALDGTFERKPFTQVLHLIPMAEEVVRLNALCMMCRDGTQASFSKRIANSEDVEFVGGIESYIPTCRKCFMGATPPVKNNISLSNTVI